MQKRALLKKLKTYLYESKNFSAEEFEISRTMIDKILESNPDWKPISTAPKDGTFVHLLIPSGKGETKYDVKIGRFVMGSRKTWFDINNNPFPGKDIAPSHWKPWIEPDMGCSHLFGPGNIKYRYCPLCGLPLIPE